MKMFKKISSIVIAIIIAITSFTVANAVKVDFKDVKINTGTTKKVTLNNPYGKDYKFKLSNKKIASISTAYFAEDTRYTYPVKALKKGSTTVKVYLKGTQKYVGSFKISVGTVPTKVKSKYKTVKLKYNSHGSSAYMSQSHISLRDILKDKKANTTYSVKYSSNKVVEKINSGVIYATGVGTVTATVYEKVGSKKKKSIDTFKIKVSKAKMSYVAKENYAYYDDGIFGNGDFVEYLSLKDKGADSLNMQGTIKSALINNPYTGSHFKSSQYKITYKSDNTKVATVSSKGVVTAKSYGTAVIKYTITFSDKSKISEYCPVIVSDD